MKVIKYLLPPFEDGFIGPQMSEWTSSKTLFALHDFSWGNWERCCLLTTHSSQTWEKMVIWGRPVTISFCCNDENQQAFKDPLHVSVRPITKARSKKIKEAIDGLIQEIWTDSNTEHSKLGPKEDEGVINLIQAIEN